MTRLLVSVRDETEALAALRGGAHLIDLKEPSAGPLGCVAPEIWHKIRSAVGSATPLSLALGELSDERLAARAALARGFQYAKIGLAGMRPVEDWPGRWRAAWEALPEEVTRVAVAYADAETCLAPSPHDVLRWSTEVKCRVLLVDTATKLPGHSLFEYLPPRQLRAIFARARDLGMRVVLAGSLKPEHRSAALELAPDYLAVRGAVCRGERTGPVDSELVRDWVNALNAAGDPRVTRHSTIIDTSPRSSPSCPSS